MKSLSSAISVVASSTTLICCALPALFVSLGLGAAFVGLISALPGLVWFSENKIIVFGFAGLMILLSAFFQWGWKAKACSIKAQKFSRILLVTSIIFYLTGAFFAFVMS